MRISWQIFAVVILGNIPACFGADSISLEFNPPFDGAIKDRNGHLTGFSTRLPGTGSALPASDPNMDLQSNPGKLLLTSTHADLNQAPGPTGNNLAMLEAPGVLLKGVTSSDVSVRAIFRNVRVPNGSDHLVVYAGVNENLFICAGVHELNVFTIFKNTGSGNVGAASPANSFSNGDDVEVTLSRRAGTWTLSWRNLTTKTAGSLAAISCPSLDEHADLYFGILASNAGTVPNQPTIKSFIATVDNFAVNVVPTAKLEKTKARDWTIDSDDHAVQAEFKGAKVMLRLPNGRTRAVDMSKLSEADRDFIMATLGKKEAATNPKPAPPGR